MTEGPDNEQWKAMLRAVLGDEAADSIIRSMEEQGFDPSAMGMFPGGAGGPDFGMVLSQLRSMLSGDGDGPVDWTLAERVARETLTREGADQLTNGEAAEAKDRLSLASMWLDSVTAVEPVYGPLQAWTRLDWIAHAQSTFRRLTEPVAANLGQAFSSAMNQQLSQLPEELQGLMSGQAGQMMMRMMASVAGMQYGAALADLAKHCLGSTDIGLPLVEGATAALVPTNIAEFGEDLEVEESEVALYVAVREQAHARLFAHHSWLRAYLLDTVAAWARDIRIDMEAVEEQIRGIDIANMSEAPDLDLTDVFSPAPTEAQEAVLNQLETILALIEGWVSVVTEAAVASHLPEAARLSEMFIRRRATGSPAETTFGNLVGLELTPRRVREAAEFWRKAGEKGTAERDHLWSHPDLLPDSDALDDPKDYLQASESDIESEIDSLLADIFAAEDEGRAPEGPHEPSPGERGPDDQGGEDPAQ